MPGLPRLSSRNLQTLRSGSAILCVPRKPFNPQALISHLTNSNGCGNFYSKVLLTVSPFRPSFRPQLDPSPRSPQTLSPSSTDFLPRANPRGTPISAVSPLSTAFTPNRSLTPLSTAFTQNTLVVASACRTFQRHTRVLLPAITTFRMNTCKSVSKQRTLTPFRMNTYAKTGGEGGVIVN